MKTEKKQEFFEFKSFDVEKELIHSINITLSYSNSAKQSIEKWRT